MSLEEAFEIAQVGQQVKRIADVLTASQKDVFVVLPGLQNYWPCGIRDRNGELSEHGGGGSSLAQTGVSPTGYDGQSYVHVGNGVNFFAQTLIGAITGTEGYMDTTIRGLTVGCWIMVDTTPPSINHGIISKDGVNPQRGYHLGWTPANEPFFSLSGTGAGLKTAVAPASTIGVWHFIVGRFKPSTEVAIFSDGDKSVNITAIPAAAFVSTQNFELGRTTANNSTVIHAKIRDAFVCAAALEDDILADLRANSQP